MFPLYAEYGTDKKYLAVLQPALRPLKHGWIPKTVVLSF